MRLPRNLLPIALLASFAGGPGGLPPVLGAQMVPGPDDPLRVELESVRRATAKYQHLDMAVRDGYVLSRLGLDFPLMGEHWVNRELLDRPLDLFRPAILQYVRVGGERVLVGVAYGQWRRPGEPLPDGFTGAEDQWHSHDLTALAQDLMGLRAGVVRSVARGRSGALRGGADGPGQLAMLHAWLWSYNPDGVFANRNPALPYMRAGIPEVWADPDDQAAPRAIGLLIPGACRALLHRLERMAGAGPFPASALAEPCDDAAERVRMALRAGAGGDAFNAIAASAWLNFLESAREALAPGLVEPDEERASP